MSVPAMNPFVAFTVTLLSVAHPPAIGAVPKVLLPIEKVTVPAIVPDAVELTDATNSVAPPRVNEAGAAVSVVVVTAGPATVSAVLPLEIA
jgi:hypothetical protein